MTGDEIRSSDWRAGGYESSDHEIECFKAEMLREIAAQLAELNTMLARVLRSETSDAVRIDIVGGCPGSIG